MSRLQWFNVEIALIDLDALIIIMETYWSENGVHPKKQFEESSQGKS